MTHELEDVSARLSRLVRAVQDGSPAAMSAAEMIQKGVDHDLYVVALEPEERNAVWPCYRIRGPGSRTFAVRSRTTIDTEGAHTEPGAVDTIAACASGLPRSRLMKPLARRLIEAQFPDLELSSLSLLGQGWDMTVWLVNERWVFRFPRRDIVIPGLTNETANLPLLAPLLPLPIPSPTYLGEASPEYGWPFYGAPFLPGRELADAGLDDFRRTALGRPLGEFLRTLHHIRVDADLPLDPVRRADMTFRVPKTRERLAELEQLGLWRAPREAHNVIDDAVELGPPEPTALVHGDLHLRHLLVDNPAGRRPSSTGLTSATTIPASTSSSTGACCHPKAAVSFARLTERSPMTNSSAPASSRSSSAARSPSTATTRECHG